VLQQALSLLQRWMIERDMSLEDNETNHRKAVSMDLRLERLPMLLCGGDEAQADDHQPPWSFVQATSPKNLVLKM
jgi:hypothetical protein